MHNPASLRRQALSLLVSASLVMGMLPVTALGEEQAASDDCASEALELDLGADDDEPSGEYLADEPGLPEEASPSDEQPGSEHADGTSDAEAEVPGDEADGAEPDDAEPEGTDSLDEGELFEQGGQAKQLSVSYAAHVQKIGWQKAVSNGEVAGTSGQSLRVEALNIRLSGDDASGITYRTHVQKIGWQDWVSDGEDAGTTGKSLRIEAIEIRLTGDAEKTHDVWYRGHVQKIGWQEWKKNGETAGTSGQSLRVEALQIVVLPKGSDAPSTQDGGEAQAPTLRYRASLDGIGWQGWMEDGDAAGAQQSALSVDGIAAELVGIKGGISYAAHVSGTGWMAAQADGGTAGKTGSGKGIEALSMQLTGPAATTYDLYYHVYAPGYGWLAWAKNGEQAGSMGLKLSIQAYEALLVEKGAEAPSSAGLTEQALLVKPEILLKAHVQKIGWQDWVPEGETAGTSGRSLRVEALEAQTTGSVSGGVRMRAHVQSIGWQDWAAEGEIAGTSGRSLRVEALQMSLTGELSQQYDVYYRVHAQKIGWMGWAKNGESAGTEALSLRLEGVQVKLVCKGGAAPGSTANAYINGKNVTKLGYQNPSGFYQVSSKNVTITSAARAPFNYITPSRIGVWATRQDCVNAFLGRAREYVGTPYVWNYACAPGVGVDCIGLVYQCAYAVGMDLGGGTGDNDFNPWAHYASGSSGWHSHDANNFWYYGKAKHVPVSSRQPGDVLWWPGHVAIYLGGDTLIEAYTYSTGVIYSSLSSRDYPSGCIRLFQ